MQKTHCIGIAGGSGSGKSTLAVALAKKYPEQIAVLHLDDYGAKKENIPMLNGFLNREHPDAIRFDDLHRDLHALQNGHAITVRTKSELYNPGYTLEDDNKIEYTIEPKHIIIVEGYLVFHDTRIRDLMDKKYIWICLSKNRYGVALSFAMKNILKRCLFLCITSISNQPKSMPIL